MVLSAGSIVHDVVLAARGWIASGVTDPIAGTRPGSSVFTATNFPTKDVQYPIITIGAKRSTSHTLGALNDLQQVYVDLQVRVYARNVKERDGLADAVNQTLRTGAYGVSSGSQPLGLFDFKQLNEGDLDEPDDKSKQKVYQKIQTYQYFCVV